MAYSDNFPATRPVFMADFANGGKIDPRATFTRASTANVFDGSKHLSSENLFAYSASSSLWSLYNGASKADGAANGPDGSTNTAHSVTFDDTTQYVNTGNSGLDTSASYTFSFYAKVATGTLTLSIGNVASGVFTNITVTTDWQRFSVTQTPTATTRYPNIRPNGASGLGTLLLWGLQLEQSATATAVNATSGSIHREYAPSLVSKSNNVARFDHTTDGQSMGCLVESSSTNLSRYGSALGSWANLSLNARVESNVAIAPSGLLEADLIGSSNTTSATRYAGDYSISLTSGTTYTASVYLKAAGHRYAQLCGISTGWATSDLVNYDLQTGTVTAGGSATGTLTDVGNGWFRATATMTANGTTSGSFLLAIVSSLSDYRLKPFTGDEYAGILAWGFQTEASNFASSLVDTGTSSSTATRAAESLSVTDSSLFDNGGGSLVVEAENVGRAYYAAVLENDSTSVYQDYVALTVRADNKARQTVNAPGSTGASDEFSAASTVGGGYFKIGSRFAPNDFGVCIDGGAVSTDTSGAVPSNVDKLFIGWYDDGGRANAHIKRVAIYSEALSDTNLISLTS